MEIREPGHAAHAIRAGTQPGGPCRCSSDALGPAPGHGFVPACTGTKPDRSAGGDTRPPPDWVLLQWASLQWAPPQGATTAKGDHRTGSKSQGASGGTGGAATPPRAIGCRAQSALASRPNSCRRASLSCSAASRSRITRACSSASRSQFARCSPRAISKGGRTSGWPGSRRAGGAGWRAGSVWTGTGGESTRSGESSRGRAAAVGGSGNGCIMSLRAGSESEECHGEDRPDSSASRIPRAGGPHCYEGACQRTLRAF